MKDHVYSVSEVFGSSSKSLEAAIDNAVETASSTLKNLEWFQVSEIRGHIEEGKVAHYQVGIKLGFRYEK
jgi:flavin-binding protein dodecin